MAVESSVKKIVGFGRVRLPKGFNIRGDELPEKERDMLVHSFKEHGVIHDVSVEEHFEGRGRKKEPVYLVTEGFGRMGALLYLWEKEGRPTDDRWQVTVTVVSYSSRLDPFMRNLAENVHRRAVKQADLARRLSQIVKGELLDPKDGRRVKERATVAELAGKMKLSEGFVRDMIRAWDKASPEVRAAWRKEEVRTDHVRAWAALPASEQNVRLAATLRGEPTLGPRKKSDEASGHGASANGASGGVEEAPSSSEETTTAAGRTGSTDAPRGAEASPRSEADDDGPRPPSRSELLARVALLGADLDSGSYKGRDLVARRAAWAALRWAAGEVRTLRLT